MQRATGKPLKKQAKVQDAPAKEDRN